MRSPTYTGFVIMCAGAAVMASLSPVRAVFTVALIVVLALKLAEEEEALKAARPEEWAKYSEILGFDIDFRYWISMDFLDVYRLQSPERQSAHMEQIRGIDTFLQNVKDTGRSEVRTEVTKRTVSAR